VLDGCEYPAAVQIVPNRHAAIELALRGAAPGSAVLLCGFGAETWTNDHSRTPVCDLDVATQLMGQAAPAVEPTPVAAELPSLRIFRGRVA
jgi:hypothetical protein